MNKSVISGIVIGAALATAGGVFAGYRILQHDDATEVAAAGATPAASAPEAAAPVDNCVPEKPRDEKRVAGTVIGALVGGAVGKDVGDKKVTTAAGAAAGAIAGNAIQKKLQEKRANGC